MVVIVLNFPSSTLFLTVNRGKKENYVTKTFWVKYCYPYSYSKKELFNIKPPK